MILCTRNVKQNLLGQFKKHPVPIDILMGWGRINLNTDFEKYIEPGTFQ